MNKTRCAALVALLLACGQAWAINKCTGPDGKVSFQDAPCTTDKAEVLHMRRDAAPSVAPVPKHEVAPIPPQPAAAAAQPAAAPQRTRADFEADQCLDWYRPKLRDPAGAYYREPSKEGRVLSITLIWRLTWSGQDFAQSIMDDTLWRKAKENVLKPLGSWTFAVLGDYLNGEIIGGIIRR